MAAFILNFQGPQDVDDIAYCYDRGGSNLNSLIADATGLHVTGWTVPESAKPGDIAVFACARTASDRLGMARARIKELGDDVLLVFADDQMDLYKVYSGKLMAVGVVADDDITKDLGWDLPGRNIVNLRLFSRPIDTKELNGVIKLNRFGSVTHLTDKQWLYLRDFINRSELESQVNYMNDLSQYDVWKDNWKKPKSSKYQKERNKMSERLRYEVLKRDGFRCVLCGRMVADGIKLEVDHIKPVSKGGLTEIDNLRTLCDECNGGKSNLWDEDGVN